MTLLKPRLGKIRISLAVAIAGISDVLQIPIHAMSGLWLMAMPGEAADLALDIATGILLTLVIGFHPVFVPSFVAKAVRSIELIPTWTACVGYAVWARKSSGEEPEPAANGGANPQPAPATAQKATAIPAKRSGLWILATGVVAIGGVLWLRHKPVVESYGGFSPKVRQHSADPGFLQQIGQTPPPKAPVAIPTESARRPHIPGQSVVAVGPLENHVTGSGEKLNTAPERICTVIEESLSRIEGIELIQHEQMRYLRSRLKDKTDGFSEAEKNAVLLNMTPANIIVLAAIVDLRSDKLDFNGYGVEMQSVETKCSLRVQVIDAASGSVLFAKLLSGSKVQAETAALATASTGDAGFDAITSALHTLDGDAAFSCAVHGVTFGEPVEVEITTTPDNTAIEIDGQTIGASPKTLPLPAGHDVKLRISKTGFKTWQRTIVPLPGLRIDRDLEPIKPK